MKQLFSLIFLIAFCYSCQKDPVYNTNNIPSWKKSAQITARNSTNTKRLLNTEGYSQNENPQTAMEIFQGTDHVYLQWILTNHSDEIGVYMSDLASSVENYFLSVHQIDLKEEFFLTSAETVSIGLFYAALESGHLIFLLNEPDPNSVISKTKKGSIVTPNMTDDESCFYAMLGGFFALRDIKSIVRDFTTGMVGKRTILRTIRFALGRAATVFAVGAAIYQLGDCLHWW